MPSKHHTAEPSGIAQGTARQGKPMFRLLRYCSLTTLVSMLLAAILLGGLHQLHAVAHVGFDGLLDLLALILDTAALRDRGAEVGLGGAVADGQRYFELDLGGGEIPGPQVAEGLAVVADQNRRSGAAAAAQVDGRQSGRRR